MIINSDYITYTLDSSGNWYGEDTAVNTATNPLVLPSIQGTSNPLGTKKSINMCNQLIIWTMGAGSFGIEYSVDKQTWYKASVSNSNFSTGAISIVSSTFTVPAGNYQIPLSFGSPFLRVINNTCSKIMISVGNS